MQIEIKSCFRFGSVIHAVICSAHTDARIAV